MSVCLEILDRKGRAVFPVPILDGSTVLVAGIRGSIWGIASVELPLA
jgi:hypothetical protein